MISNPASIIATYAIGCATRYCYGLPSMLVVCEWAGGGIGGGRAWWWKGRE